jgi:S-DNA-T family DNA segregation ATPase FtsK/SpoIIIE
MANPTGWRPLPALGCAGTGIGTASLLGLILGERFAFSIFGWHPLASLGDAWQAFLGLGALPAALLVTVSCAWLLGRPDEDPWKLPWGRALAVEVLLIAILALLGLGAGMRGAVEAGPEGLVGWSLAAVSREALGLLPAGMFWLITVFLAGMAAFSLGGQGIASALEALADAVEPLPDPDSETIAPASHPRVGPAAGGPAGLGAATSVAGAGASSEAGPGSGRPSASTAGRRAQSPMPEANLAASSVTPATGQGAEIIDAQARPASREAGPTAEPRRRPIKVRDASASATSSRKAPRRSDLLPSLDLLDEAAPGALPADDEALREVGRRIEDTLESFGVPVRMVEIERGPTFTRFGLQPGFVMRGDQRLRVKLSSITALRQDLALALAAPSVRIEAPVPGRDIVGVELPNSDSGVVSLRTVLEDPAFRAIARKQGLALAMGREVTGQAVVSDLCRMPHLLVAGATGSGKSVFLNALLASLLFQATPDTLKLVLIDPKRVELARFGQLPHLVAGVVTDPAEAVGALRWAVAEMERRYRQFAEVGARDRAGFNAQSPAGEAPMPAIVVVIDELADLMMTAPEEVEPLLTRLAQMARATGIHLVVATQRPSTDVITGLIKANFPTRVAFAVASGIDSRVILDQQGAETLLGRGDMLYQPPDQPHMRRLQGVWLSDAEIDRLIAFWRGSHWDKPRRLPPWEDLIPSDDPDAELFHQAQAIAEETVEISASLLQRRLRIGYQRARKIYDRLIDEGLATGQGSTDSEGFDWVSDEFER